MLMLLLSPVNPGSRWGSPDGGFEEVVEASSPFDPGRRWGSPDEGFEEVESSEGVASHEDVEMALTSGCSCSSGGLERASATTLLLPSI